MLPESLSIYIKDLFGLGTACAVAAAAGAGAAASLHFWGRFKGSSSAILTAELGTAFASAFLCAWCFRPGGFLGGCFTGKNERESASCAPPGARIECCTNSSGVSCCEEGTGRATEGILLSEADLEDLQASDLDLNGLARGASAAMYVQPNALRRMAAMQKQSGDGEPESDARKENGVFAGAASCACSTVEEVSRYRDDSTAGEGAFLPGRAKVYFKTFGCSHNVSDSEYMRKRLATLSRCCSLSAIQHMLVMLSKEREKLNHPVVFAEAFFSLANCSVAEYVFATSGVCDVQRLSGKSVDCRKWYMQWAKTPNHWQVRVCCMQRGCSRLRATNLRTGWRTQMSAW